VRGKSWLTWLKLACLSTLVLLAYLPTPASALNDRETGRIEYLISSVESLPGVKFQRNGSEHGGKEAAAHLRMKLRRAGTRVRTAENFITLCASKSYLSGKPYQILFPDGKTVPAETFFLEQLKKYDLDLKPAP
jgi:hypothetical protein